jgi:hypothetical protein
MNTFIKSVGKKYFKLLVLPFRYFLINSCILPLPYVIRTKVQMTMAKSTLSVFLPLMVIVLQTSGAAGTNWITINSNNPTPAEITLISTDINSSTIRFTLDGFYLNESCERSDKSGSVRVDNSSPLLVTGFPDLVGLTGALVLPDKGEMKLRIVSSEFKEYQNILILSSPGDWNRNTRQHWDHIYKNVYRENAFWPGILAECGEPFIVRDIRGQTVTVYPFQYNPVSKVLRVYYEVVVALVVDENSGNNPLNGKCAEPSPSEFKDIYAYQFLNYKKEDSRKDDPAGLIHMLIISDGKYIGALQPLIDWKMQQGIMCEVVDVENLGNDAGGIKDYVKNKYYTDGLSYLLLVGDLEDVPSVRTELGWSDNSYGYVSGVDHYPDIFVGRFSASTLNHVMIQVERTIRYEKYDFASYDWISKNAGIASDQGPGDDNEMDFEHVRNLQRDLLNSSYTYSYELYDGSQGNEDSPGDPNWLMIRDAVDRGAGCILYTGVGDCSSWETSGFTTNDVFQLSNKDRYPFIISAGCYGGQFGEQVCLAEAWLRASKDNVPTGAVAVLMASGKLGWYPPMHAQDAMVHLMTDNTNGSEIKTFGEITMGGCIEMNNKYGQLAYNMTDIWNISGDPSLIIHTGTPKPIDAQLQDAITSDTKCVEIACDVDAAKVILTNQSTIVGVGKIKEGHASIKLDGDLLKGNLTVSITAFNHVPFIKEIPVISYPTSVTGCIPENHKEMVSPYVALRWSKGFGGKPLYYKVYLGTDNPPTNEINGIVAEDTLLIPRQKLDYDKIYFWRIDAYNDYGYAMGDTWQFTVISSPDEDFEDASLPRSMWTVMGASGWEIDSTQRFNGYMSCRSGLIADNESSSLLFYSDNETDDFVSFWYKVSSEQGKDKFEFLIDGEVNGEWSGEIGWTYWMIQIPSGNHILEWRYSKDTRQSSGCDVAWIDDIYLPINGNVFADAGQDAFVCRGESFTLSGYAENFTSVKWTSSGSGTFKEPSALKTTYIPNDNDYKNTKISVTLTVYNEYTFTSVNSNIEMNFTPSPAELEKLNDTTLLAGEEIILDATSNEIQSYLWLPSYSTSPTLTLRADEMESGSHKIRLQVNCINGCTFEKEVTITFIDNSDKDNNNNLGLDIYPNPCNDYINVSVTTNMPEEFRIRVNDGYGKLVYGSESILFSDCYSCRIDLSNLPKGLYFVQIAGINSLKTKKLIVQ